MVLYMSTLRQELDDVLSFKKSSGGFHYVYQAEKLGDKAHRARKWYNLLKTPISKWKTTLADTRFVLKTLKENGIYS